MPLTAAPAMPPFAMPAAVVPSANAEEIRIPKITVLTLSLDQELEAKKVKKGKELKAHLSEPVTGDDGQEIIPAGSEVKGKIEDADERHLDNYCIHKKNDALAGGSSQRLFSLHTDLGQLAQPGRDLVRNSFP